MLNPNAKFTDINYVQWRRLTELAYLPSRGRRIYLIHEGGKPVRLWDTEKGEQATPSEAVTDPQAAADKLYAATPGVLEAVVVDPDGFHRAMSTVQAQTNLDQQLDDYMLAEFKARRSAEGHAVSPANDLIWHGLPLERVKRFVERMLPDSCCYVLGVFDGDQLWASVIVQFENKQIVGVHTTDALPAEDVKDIVGRDQHPFFLSVVGNTFRRPVFGWFVERAEFEAWMKAPSLEDKDEIFQKAIMGQRATFDFNILVDRGLTALSPMNPGEAAIVGQDREANPRTRTPDPSNPGPSAY